MAVPRCIALASVASVVLASCRSPPPTVAHASGELRFLGAQPIGPLARVSGGKIDTPDPRACRTWGSIGSRWLELDALGQIAGEMKVVSGEYYDVSGCDELSLERLRGHRGAGVYVDALAAYRPPRASRWRPDAGAAAALERLSSARQSKIKDLDPSVRVPFNDRAFFLAWGESGERYALVGGKSVLVFTFRGGRWDNVHEETPPKMRALERGFAVLAVTDMDGDGQPEIVVHEREEQGEWYGDATLSLGADGTWRRIAPGIFGSTA
jgi:hypothetical protein